MKFVAPLLCCWFGFGLATGSFAETTFSPLPVWLDAEMMVNSSPPREYFSVNTFTIDTKSFVHIGHDLVNQNYVIFPSPSVEHIERVSADKRRVFLRLYYPEAEAKILATYNIQPSKLLYLSITSLQLFDQAGKLVDENIIPPGVNYRPPQTYQLEVNNEVKLLNFVVGFTGRTAWSDSGISSDLQGLYREFEDIGIDRNASLELRVAPGSSVSAYEVYASQENQRIAKILSSLQLVVAWGRMAGKEDLINQIANLKNFQEVSLDLSKGAEDLKKYPHLFGNPVDAKYTSVIKKLASEKLSEQEMTSEDSFSAKVGFGGFFSAEGGASSKRVKRFKDMIKFDVEGEFYVPKALKFTLRAKNSFELINRVVFHAYDHLEETQYFMGTGVQLKEFNQGKPLSLAKSYLSPFTLGGTSIDYRCNPGSALSGLRSSYSRTTFDNEYQFECRKLYFYQEPIETGTCTQTAALGAKRTNVVFECAGDSFLTGIKSDYVIADKDRVSSFSCCSLETPLQVPLKKGACQWSGWLNNYETAAAYSCPIGTIQSGLRSEVDATGTYFGRKFNIACCEPVLF
jgi:hypothetical protein